MYSWDMVVVTIKLFSDEKDVCLIYIYFVPFSLRLQKKGGKVEQ